MKFYLQIFIGVFVVTFCCLYLLFMVHGALKASSTKIINERAAKALLISDCESKGGAMLETASGFKCFKLEIIK